MLHPFMNVMYSCLLPPQIPQIFYTLQSSVQAVLLGEVVETNWNSQGVPAKSRVEVWPLDHPVSREEGEGRKGSTALASDGQFLYFHGPFGLLKAGSGYGNTKRVRPSSHGVFTTLDWF